MSHNRYLFYYLLFTVCDLTNFIFIFYLLLMCFDFTNFIFIFNFEKRKQIHERKRKKKDNKETATWDKNINGNQYSTSILYPNTVLLIYHSNIYL